VTRFQQKTQTIWSGFLFGRRKLLRFSSRRLCIDNPLEGIEVPYLTSVPSKQDVTSINYLKIVEFRLGDLLELLKKYYTDFKLTAANFFDEVEITARDSAGYVLKIDLGSLSINGEEFAKVLGLSSNHFYI
jgi:stage II sporulation protein D